jgi:hypothetical protein
VNPLDLDGELEMHSSEVGVSVTVPLAESEGDWIRRYNQLARSEGPDAQVEPQPGRVVLRVTVASDSSREQTFELLDAAVSLIERAKREAENPREAALAVDPHVREWWSTQGATRSVIR